MNHSKIIRTEIEAIQTFMEMSKKHLTNMFIAVPHLAESQSLFSKEHPKQS